MQFVFLCFYLKKLLLKENKHLQLSCYLLLIKKKQKCKSNLFTKN